MLSPRRTASAAAQGLTCEYWAYYHWVGGGWQYSQIGAGGYTVTDGALEGWSWGAGNFSSGVEPPAVTLAEVCPPPATATPTGNGDRYAHGDSDSHREATTGVSPTPGRSSRRTRRRSRRRLHGVALVGDRCDRN